MAVAFDAVSSAAVANSAGQTLSWTHTPVGTPTAVSVGLQLFSFGTMVPSGITYGGVAMVQATSANDSAGPSTVQIWGLANPPSGPQTIIITFTDASGNYCSAGAITVTGSDTTTCFTSSNSAAFTAGTSESLSTTSNVGELIVDVLGIYNASAAVSGGSQTLRWGPLAAAGDRGQGSTSPASAGSTAMSWTFTSSAGVLALASFKAGGVPVTVPVIQSVFMLP